MRKAFLQLHVAILLAGFTGILGRLITLNEGLLVWYRMLFSTLAILVLALVSGGLPKMPPGRMLVLAGIGGIIALHWVFFYASIKYANVSIALVCFSAIGFFTALLEPILLRRRIRLSELGLGLVAIIGISLIFQFDARYQTGILLGLISSLLAACFPILNKSIIKDADPTAITLYEMGGGWLLLTLLMPVYLLYLPTLQFLPSASDLFWLLILSIFCTVWAFRLSLSALRLISPFTVNLSFNLEPVYGILLAFLVYREDQELGGGFYPGLFLIFLSVILQSWRIWKLRPIK